jgi:hypothetical protein
MDKQKIKQAAEKYGRLIDSEHPSNAATDFLAGIAWQKEQTPYTLEQVERVIDMARSPSWSKEELINYLNTGIIPD